MSAPMNSDEGLIAVGRIRRSRGNRGEVIVDAMTSWPQRFLTLSRVHLVSDSGELESRRIEKVWFHKGDIILHLEGCLSIGDAEKLRGRKLLIPEEESVKLGENEYYQHQLIGLKVFSDSQEFLGCVESILETGSADVLVVQGTEEKEFLIPLAKEFLKTVDLQQGILVVQLPAGLLEINES